uniref:Hexosyltransferase n=1 Tax=Haptolina ericina TaxID=156174 RepID=A0A7S3ES53_9EUKA|mmetsp:Transcript_13063/g.29830  ORF Transcript_13063/g.29830 Transcript_13063/m.29830 type:complete len:377 (+) Transcript_13063:134-1264(+)
MSIGVPLGAREAYATMWYGGNSTAPAFKGMHALLQSIRLQDSVRPIVVITSTTANATTVPAWWPDLGQYAPVELETQEPLQVKSRHCREGLAPGSTHSRAWRLARLTNNQTLAPTRPGLRFMMIKFALWRMVRFDRIIYLDSDALILRPLDRLWQLPHIGADGRPWKVAAASVIHGQSGREELAARCPRAGTRTQGKFNAGVLVVRPDVSVYEEARQKLQHPKTFVTCKDGDQTLHNVVLRQRSLCISHSYNCYHHDFLAMRSPPSARFDPISCLHEDGPGAADTDTHADASLPHIVHFAMTTKPWLTSKVSSAYFYGVWAEILARALNRSSILQWGRRLSKVARSTAAARVTSTHTTVGRGPPGLGRLGRFGRQR